MGLSIKSIETERAVRELAAATGESLTEAVHNATVYRLKTLGRRFKTEVERREAREAWFAQLDARLIPGAPSREEIEAEMYDEFGCPR